MDYSLDVGILQYGPAVQVNVKYIYIVKIFVYMYNTYCPGQYTVHIIYQGTIYIS